MNEKPDAKFSGVDGNVFNLIGIANRSLRQSGNGDKVSEMNNRVTSSGSYDEALQIMAEYVNII